MPTEGYTQQSLPQYMHHADSLFADQQWSQAALAYERAYFFAPNTEEQQRALFQKSYALKAQHQYQKAYKTLQRLPAHTLANDSTQFALHYEIAINAFLANEYTTANLALTSLQSYVKDSLLRNKALFLQILTLNELQQWKEAEQVFIQFLQNQQLPPQNIDLYYGKLPKFKKPKTATWLSTFIPGMGQLYAGAWKEAIVSLSLNAGFLAIGGYSFWHRYWATGFASGFAPFQAFYFGGIENAEAVTHRYNQKKAKRFNQKIKQFVIENSAQ